MTERAKQGYFDFGNPDDPLFVWVGRDGRTHPVLTPSFKTYVNGRFQVLHELRKGLDEGRKKGLDTSALSRESYSVTEQLIEAFTPK